MSGSRGFAASVALGGGLLAVALGAKGGTELDRTTVVEVLLVLSGAAMVVAAILRAPDERPFGGLTVAAFAAFAVLTALSISWSIAPDQSYEEAGRTFAYLAVFAGAVAAARLRPSAGRVVAGGVLLGAVAIVGYGLLARVWPATLTENAVSGRIGLPFNYWNALGGVAAIGALPAVWLGTRKAGPRVLRALAFPALGLLILTLLLTQSRGALAGAALALLIWLAVVPLRLHTLVLVGVSAAGALPVSIWALDQDPFNYVRSAERVAEREAVAGDFGVYLLLLVVGLLLAGQLLMLAAGRRSPSPGLRARVGLAVAVVALAIPIVAATAVATSERGLTGSIEDGFDELTDESAAPPRGSARIASVSSSRGAYWKEARRVFGERELLGRGAGAFAVARLRYRKEPLNASRAHGFPAQTAADLGLVGITVALALLAAWMAAALGATGFARRQARKPDWTVERTARVALGLGVFAYAVQSAIDWTWFVPGTTVLALVPAGFLAGAGEPDRTGTPGVPSASPERLLAAAAVVVAALLCCWAIWQPRQADQMTARAYELQEAGDPRGAIEEARAAHERNPYSNEPLYAEAAALIALDRPIAARRVLARAVRDHPRDPDAWVRLATFEQFNAGDPARAEQLLRAALALDPQSKQTQMQFLQAQAEAAR